MRRRHDSWVVVALRALLAAAAATAAGLGASTSAGLAALAIGAASGAVLGEVLGRSGLRLVVAFAAAAALAGVGLLGSLVASRVALVSSSIGPAGAVAFGDAVLLAGLATGLVLGLRATATRFRAAVAFEVALFAAALVTPLAAHRDGAINRPLALGDYAWSRGEDPVAYLELAGAVAAVGLALFLIAERRWARALSALVLVGLLAAVAGLVGSMVLPPPVMAQDGLGLTGEEQSRKQGRQGERPTDRMEFRDSYSEQGQGVPVAVVLLHDDFEPPSGVYYFRQNAFSQWNGRRLVPALTAGADQDLFETFPAGRTLVRSRPPPERRRPVSTTVAFLADHPRPFVLEAAESVSPARNPAPRRFRRVYEATSLALDASLAELLGSEVGDPAWSDDLRRIYGEAPTDPRYRELAAEIVAMLPGELRDEPVARAAAVAHYLGRRGTYSRRSGHSSADDPTASFLFGDMTGYCVHFAHAAAYLYRAAGVPSRVATGYAYSGADRGRGSSLLIRGGDAHAWPEIYVREVGWVVVDVAPASVAEGLPPPLDAELQRMLGEMLRGQLDEQRRATLEVGRPDLGLEALRRVAAALGRGGGLGLVCLVVLLYLWKASRRLAPLAVGGDGRTRRAYRAALDGLADVGRRRGLGEPPETFAARVSELSPAFGGLVSVASAARLGSKLGARPDLALGLGRKVAAELRAGVPWWRRALGALDPVSWLRAR